MKSRKQKIAKKAKQGLRNYQRKLDHEIRLQSELGTERFGYWQQDKPPQGKRVYHIEIVIKEKVVDRTFVDGYRTEPCNFGDIYGVVVNHLDELYEQNPQLSPHSYRSFARIRT